MVDREKILAGRNAVDGYRLAHRKLYEGGWHKGISEEQVLLLNKLLADLKELGFNSLEEFEKAEKPYRMEFLVEEFDKQATQREVRFLDLSQFSFAYNMAAIEAEATLRRQDRIPDTLFYLHSNLEEGICFAIASNAAIDSVMNVAEARKYNIPFVRTIIPSNAVCLVSSNNPTPYLISKGIYGQETGFGLWLRIMERTWDLFGISTIRSPTNDLLIGDKKLTGVGVMFETIVSASTSTLDMDIDLVKRTLISRSGREIAIASLCLGRKIPFSEFQDKFFQAIREILHIEIIPGELTQEERDFITGLMPKYLSEAFTFTGEYSA